VTKDSVDSVVNLIQSFKISDKFLILSKLEVPDNIDLKDFFQFYFDQGYARIEYNGETINILDASEKKIDKPFYLIIDRSIYKKDEDYLNRIIDSVENAFFHGNNELYVKTLKDNKYHFSLRNSRKTV